jgi:hypothetical protein
MESDGGGLYVTALVNADTRISLSFDFLLDRIKNTFWLFSLQ